MDANSLNSALSWINELSFLKHELEYQPRLLDSVATTQQPFCLIVSLVNPNDVLAYPNSYVDFGYDTTWLNGMIEPPETVNEHLHSKPRAQQEFLWLSNVGLGRIDGVQGQREYFNFYGNLMKLADKYLVQVLDKLDKLQLTENTMIIRTSGHDEMGLALGGQRQKNFSFYEESLNIPLIFSNPKLYPSAVTSEALMSHVDFLPTLASLFDAPEAAKSPWQGVDYATLVLDPALPPVQDYIVFTYDDYQSGQKGPHAIPPKHIRSLREQRFKLAEYYDANGHLPSEWEMYDLENDPLETTNLAAPHYHRNAEQQSEYERLRAKLKHIEETRLKPLST